MHLFEPFEEHVQNNTLVLELFEHYLVYLNLVLECPAQQIAAFESSATVLDDREHSLDLELFVDKHRQVLKINIV